MAMPVLSVPQFPNVPNVPGVPALLRAAGASLPLPVLALANSLGLPDILQKPQWGIFDQSGNAVLVGDSVVGLDFRKEYRISDYPVEDGGFQSYDKVATPFDARVRFTVGGAFSGLSAINGVLTGTLSGALAGISGTAAITAFLAALDTALGSLQLYSVITPEVSYPSANVIHYDYRREARNGATMLTVDVWVREVRMTAAAQFTNTQAPSGADAVNDGTVVPDEGKEVAAQVT